MSGQSMSYRMSENPNAPDIGQSKEDVEQRRENEELEEPCRCCPRQDKFIRDLVAHIKTLPESEQKKFSVWFGGRCLYASENEEEAQNFYNEWIEKGLGVALFKPDTLDKQ